MHRCIVICQIDFGSYILSTNEQSNQVVPWWVKDEPCGECGHNLLKEHDVENCECGCHGELESDYP